MLTLARLYSFLTDYNNKTPIDDRKVDAELDQFIAAINIKSIQKDVTYTILATDDYELWLHDCTAGNIVITFDAAADHTNEVMVFARTDASGNTVTVNGVGLTVQYGMEVFFSDGTNWINLGTPTTLAAHTHTGAGDGGKLAGLPIQVVHTQTGAVNTGTTQIPVDDTIPQITEGDEYMTLAITPTNALNKLEIEVISYLTSSVTDTLIVLALFQDATANALAAATGAKDSVANSYGPITLKYEMVAGTTLATTFRVRCGTSAAGTTTFNGVSAGRLFGGVYNSFIRITEVQV